MREGEHRALRDVGGVELALAVDAQRLGLDRTRRHVRAQLGQRAQVDRAHEAQQERVVAQLVVRAARREADAGDAPVGRVADVHPAAREVERDAARAPELTRARAPGALAADLDRRRLLEVPQDQARRAGLDQRHVAAVGRHARAVVRRLVALEAQRIDRRHAARRPALEELHAVLERLGQGQERAVGGEGDASG